MSGQCRLTVTLMCFHTQISIYITLAKLIHRAARGAAVSDRYSVHVREHIASSNWSRKYR